MMSRNYILCKKIKNRVRKFKIISKLKVIDNFKKHFLWSFSKHIKIHHRRKISFIKEMVQQELPISNS